MPAPARTIVPAVGLDVPERNMPVPLAGRATIGGVDGNAGAVAIVEGVALASGLNGLASDCPQPEHPPQLEHPDDIAGASVPPPFDEPGKNDPRSLGWMR